MEKRELDFLFILEALLLSYLKKVIWISFIGNVVFLENDSFWLFNGVEFCWTMLLLEDSLIEVIDWGSMDWEQVDW